MLRTKLQVDWPFGSEEEVKKKDFQDGRHGGLGYPAIFDLQVTAMLPTKFRIRGVGSERSIFVLKVNPILPTRFPIN